MEITGNIDNARMQTAIPTLDFEPRRNRERHSPNQHFLFQNASNLTEQLNSKEVLVNETPDNFSFPVVLRRLRGSKKRSEVSEQKTIKHYENKKSLFSKFEEK